VAVNLATSVSLAACLVGLLLAAMTLAIASAPGTRGLRFFSLACFCGAANAASTAMVATSSYTLARVGTRFGLFFVSLHAATWFVYTARRGGRDLGRYERAFVAGALSCAVLALIPNALYHDDQVWLHAVPSLGILYIDTRSNVLGDVVFAYLGFGVSMLLWRSLRRFRVANRTERAEAVGLAALTLCGVNDALAVSGVIGSPYLLDLGFLALVLAVDNARELVAAHADLVQSERLAALGEMSAVVAHEVRNPVAVILNAATSMRSHPDRHDELVLIVEEEALRLKQMVTDLLDYARPTSVRLVAEPIDSIVQSALEAVRQARGNAEIEVEVSLDPELPPLLCDVRLLRQAIVNLVINALQSPERRGPVRVRVTASDDERMRLSVIDDGAGVADDIADRIFRPFFTTRPTGTGLGLAVVHRIVEAHGGVIAHRPTPGGGATFEMELPVRPAV
jgi:signal transduction histidine kinase